MAGIIILIIAGIVFLAAIIWAICDKNDNGIPILGIGTLMTFILFFTGVICLASPNSRFHRQTVNPNLDAVNNGYASIDSVGVINGITQYEIHWKDSQTGARKQ